MTRLSDAQLARLESDCEVAKQFYARNGRLPTSTGLDVLDCVPAVLSELRQHRAGDLRDEDIDALKWLQVQARAIQYDRVKAGSDGFPNPARALAVLDRLIARGGK